jgi:hypothetical protein
MNRNEFDYITEDDGISRRDLLAIGLGAAAGAALTSLRNNHRSLPSDPPPIIIKSGSFNIEADTSLNETNGSPFFYRRVGFGDIKGVRVLRTNEIDGSTDSDVFEDRNGIEVDIKLQVFGSNGWQDVGELVTVRAAAGSGSQKDFVLKIGKKLAKKGHPKPGRRERWKDDDAENIRFGQIAVRERDGGGGTYDAVDGDDFIITFYNRLR